MLYKQGTNHPVYYLPTYVRVKVLSISELKYDEMSATLNVELFITVRYPEIPLYEVEGDQPPKMSERSDEKEPYVKT